MSTPSGLYGSSPETQYSPPTSPNGGRYSTATKKTPPPSNDGLEENDLDYDDESEHNLTRALDEYDFSNHAMHMDELETSSDPVPLTIDADVDAGANLFPPPDSPHTSEEENDNDNDNDNGGDASDDENASFASSPSKILVGICAMDKKARSKPMAEILSRLDDEVFDVEIFGNSTILSEPITSWPVVDVLIAFFSDGFPLAKAEEYVEVSLTQSPLAFAFAFALRKTRNIYEPLRKLTIIKTITFAWFA